MRVIKFRAKMDGKCPGHEGVYVYAGLGGRWLSKNGMYHGDIIKDSEEQFTGIIDSGNVEIFENDTLVDYDGNEYTVIFHEGAFKYQKKSRSTRHHLTGLTVRTDSLWVRV